MILAIYYSGKIPKSTLPAPISGGSVSYSFALAPSGSVSGPSLKATYLRAQADLSEPSTLLLCPESSHITTVSKLRSCLASISSEKKYVERKKRRYRNVRTARKVSHVADCSELWSRRALSKQVQFGLLVCPIWGARAKCC